MRSQRWMPLLGTNSFDKLISEANQGSRWQKNERIPGYTGALWTGFASEIGAKRLLTTGGHYAYLKIAEGCDKHCTYCIIPKVRGNYRSVPMESLLQRGGDAGGAGCEGADSGSTGDHSLRNRISTARRAFISCLRSYVKIKGIRWIRILYCYPEEIYPMS